MKSSGFYFNRKINMKLEVKIMASIVHRNDCLLVVHYERDKISGKNKQKQELMEKNPTLHARFLRLYPKNARSGMLRRFFSHSMFAMMPV